MKKFVKTMFISLFALSLVFLLVGCQNKETKTVENLEKTQINEGNQNNQNVENLNTNQNQEETKNQNVSDEELIKMLEVLSEE